MRGMFWNVVSAAHHHLLDHTPVRSSAGLNMSCAEQHTPRLSIQVAEFAVLWLDLCGVDLWMMREDVLPPRLLVYLFEVDVDELLVL